ncbi:AAA family ATPase [Clostridium intestinale]|uniref:AAA family ATPase n=1 Tax=Clostridium intestinale TaxID=36845 RepID=A0A7D7A5L2_9CLOT|nr:AAA family ATPase [Clostridium intestinale]QLY81240.1 AAA family ATPase [Clostridium intestinale]
MSINDEIIQHFNEIIKKQKTGTFYKADLHIHTPGSKKDYKVGNKLYENVSIEELEQIAQEKGLMNKTFKQLYKNKDELMALLIIHESYDVKDLNLIVITDHNNMDWIDMIRNAGETYIRNIAKVGKNFEILPGVEITCFNGTHIIAIFDNKGDEFKNKWEFIKYELNAIKPEKNKIFTTKSEIDVVEAINKLNGIVYIPHIDNNAAGIKIKHMIDPLSGVSKAQLLIHKHVHAIGFTNYDLKESVQPVLEDKTHDYYRESPIAYLQDSDAHTVNEIGRRFMYIKMNAPSFNSLKFALQDPKLRVKNKFIEKDEISYIRGVAIKGGYLSKLSSAYNYYPFSKDLNCIIGGRGSGKSTLIKTIKSCLLGKTPDYNFRLFMGEMELGLLYIHINGIDYCIHCKPKVIKDSYTKREVNRYGSEVRGEIINIEDWISLYRIKEDKCRKIPASEQKEILNGFSVDYFDQLDILEIGKSNGAVNKFINSIIQKSSYKYNYAEKIQQLELLKSEFAKINNIIDKRDINRIEDVKKEVDKVKKDIDNIKKELIGKLNNCLHNKVKIIYEREQVRTVNILGESLLSYALNHELNIYQEGKISRVIDYLSSKYSFFEICEKFIEKDKLILLELKKEDLFGAQTIEELESDITTFEKYIEIMKEICLSSLKKLLQNSDIEKTDIRLNVNSHNEGGRQLFKELSILSLGQRAVAILTIITEGITCLDIKYPLVIDQPEDHLDNKFIYQHLIESIRRLKEKKQIIVVTHNANIPVSGDAENVMYLESNNENGWLETYGYLDNNKIQRKIIDSLEGGEDSFKLRVSKYNINDK